MEFNITTPAILFPAVSLLMLAYTNRFLSLASTIRKLTADYKAGADAAYLKQIENLRWRIRRVRDMQFCGTLSLLLCTISIFLIFSGLIFEAEVVFVVSLIIMIFSLLISLAEIQSSVRALDVHLLDLEHPKRDKN